MVEDAKHKGLTPLRAGVLLVAIGVAGPAMVVALATAGLPIPWAVVTSGVVFALTAPWVLKELPASLTPGGSARVLFACWMGVSCVAIYQMGRHSVFMYDVGRTEFAYEAFARPLDAEELNEPFYVKHNCYTAYIVGAHLASKRVRNIYEGDRYRDAEERTEVHKSIGDALTVDSYQYPPPFLLLPRLMLAMGDFFATRTYWYALNVGAICLSVVLLSAWAGGRSFGAAWFALPIILLAPVTMGALQIGNVHLLIVCLSVLAMLAFEHRRFAVGGMLLGFAVLSKLFPGLLLGYLVVTRRWRAVAWTGGWMIVLTLATLLVFGPEPFRAFFEYQVPRLASGEAFSFSRTHVRPMTVNLSVMGVAFKLSHLELLGGLDPVRVAGMLSLAFTALLVAGLVAIGITGLRPRSGSDGPGAAPGAAPQRKRSPRRNYLEAACWLAFLTLGELRSPFLPWGYANLPILWLLVLIASRGPSGRPDALVGWPVRRSGALLLTAAFAMNVPLFFGPATIAFDLWYTLVALAVLVVVCLVTVAVRAVAPLRSGIQSAIEAS